MVWRKQGLLFEAPGSPEWLTSHAALPVSDPQADGSVEVYFSSRNVQGRAQIGRFNFNPSSSSRTCKLQSDPVLSLGALGTFDDSGVNGSCIVSRGEKKYLYYTGWRLGVTVPFYFNIGLAVSLNAGATFQKVSNAPVLGLDHTDPYLTASPCVLIEGGVWRMWYVSCVRWSLDESGKPKHYYHIKYAESPDGIQWGFNRPVCIDFLSPDEYAIARPCVINDAGVYRMWYCSRGSSYRIGYAESTDGIRWTRLDHLAGIEGSEGGWDSEMQAYPWVFSHQGRTYMLYNGNGYGKTGIGIASLDSR
jgi:hypothetical protein